MAFVPNTRSIIEGTFTDRMDVWRYEEKTNDDETTDTELKQTAELTNRPCRISFARTDNPEDKMVDRNPLKTNILLFFKLEDALEAGDVVYLKRLDTTGQVIAQYNGTLGLPAVFTTHKEALVVVEGSA